MARRICPMCAEKIKAQAKICRYCGAESEVITLGWCPKCKKDIKLTEYNFCPECFTNTIHRRVERLLLKKGKPEANVVTQSTAEYKSEAKKADASNLPRAPGQVALKTTRQVDIVGLSAFIFGVIAFFTASLVIFGVIAFVLGLVAVAAYDGSRHTGRWLGITGLVLGCIYGLFVPIASTIVEKGTLP